MDRRTFLKTAAGGAVAGLVPFNEAEARPKLRERPAQNPTPPPSSRRRALGRHSLSEPAAGVGRFGAGRAWLLNQPSEAAMFVGRLTRTMETRAGTFNVEHGLHMWFYNYHNFQDIQRRLRIEDNFKPYKGVHFTFRDYEDEVLKSEPAIYPLNLIMHGAFPKLQSVLSVSVVQAPSKHRTVRPRHHLRAIRQCHLRRLGHDEGNQEILRHHHASGGVGHH